MESIKKVTKNIVQTSKKCYYILEYKKQFQKMMLVQTEMKKNFKKSLEYNIIILTC